MFWATLFFALFFSRNHPVWVSVFIILFDLYWLFKAINGSFHLVFSYKRYRFFATLDWRFLVDHLHDFPKYIEYLSEQLRHAKSSRARHYFKDEMERIGKLLTIGRKGANYFDYYHLVLYPFVDESEEVLDTTIRSLEQANYPKDKMIVILLRRKNGRVSTKIARAIKEKYGNDFSASLFRSS